MCQRALAQNDKVGHDLAQVRHSRGGGHDKAQFACHNTVLCAQLGHSVHAAWVQGVHLVHPTQS